MPRKMQHCVDCGARCYGERCSEHAHAYGLRNYPPALRQTDEKRGQTRSWWTSRAAPRAGFTRHALKNLAPDVTGYSPRYSLDRV